MTGIVRFTSLAGVRRAGIVSFAGGVLVTALAACALTAPEPSPAPARSLRADGAAAAAAAATPSGVRVFSWNVASDAFVKDPRTFRALVRMSRADILLLDEVSPSTSESQLRAALPGPETGGTDSWHIDVGRSGGRQRDVIVSRMPLESLPEFADIVPYPDAQRHELHDRMVAAGENSPDFSMDGGIPMNGAIVLAGTRSLLVVSLDLQCCGNDPGSWQEERRRIEAQAIRQRIRRVLARTHVDGIVVAGDFNLVSTPFPLIIVSGPFRAPHAGLIVAQLRHLDGTDTWTWDGRGTRFPSSALDFALYTPRTLELRGGYVLDTEDLPQSQLEKLGLRRESINPLSNHRPLVAQYAWH